MPYKEEQKRLIEMFDTNTITDNGIVRWKSNSSIPPDDLLQFKRVAIFE